MNRGGKRAPGLEDTTGFGLGETEPGERGWSKEVKS